MEWMLMPLRRYAEFSGRSRRQEFWMFALLQLLVYIVLTILASVIVGVGVTSFSSVDRTAGSALTNMVGMFAALGIFALIFFVVYLVFFIPNLAVSVRRLHDSGRSGWWLMLYFGPWIAGLFLGVASVRAQSTGLGGFNAVLSLVQLIAIVVLIVFWCLPGTTGPNQYGPDPQNRFDPRVFY